MTNAHQMVTFSADGIADVVVLLGETPAQITGGYGGWVTEPRERRKALTQWQGKDPIRMQISVLFDGVRTNEGQELPISRLSRMALPPIAGGEPPTVEVAGRGVPKPGPPRWVIESLNWGTNVIWDFSTDGVMVRMRQDCVVNLMEYVGADRVAFANIKPGTSGKVTGKSKTGWPKTHIVKPGETMAKIAVKYYKNSKLWSKISKANGIRDPKTIKPGQTLRIPAP